MWHIPAYAIILLLVARAVASPAGTMQPAPADGASESAATQPVILSSPWGVAVAGVQARCQIPEVIAQNDFVSLRIELQGRPNLLQPGITRLNPDQPDLYLVLTNAATGKRLKLDRFEMGAPPFIPEEKTFPVLDGKSTIRLEADFELHSLASHLASGDYDCAIGYTADRADRLPHTWSGNVISGFTRVTVVRPVEQRRTILVPRSLRVDPDGAVRMHSADAQRLQITVESGMFLGTETIGDDSDGLEDGPPDMDTPNCVGSFNEPWVHGQKKTFTIKVFSTFDPVRHFWSPTEKVLWRKTFTVVAP